MLAHMKGERLSGLDALRGFAALCVVAQHSIENICRYNADCWPSLGIINLGRFGVLLFFLISGFVIPPSLERGGVARFAVNRAFRLLPALWLSVAVFLAFDLSAGQTFTAGDVAANMVMLARPLAHPEIAGIYWSLSYELGFYVFCTAMFAAGLLDNRRVIALIVVAVSMMAVLTFREDWSFPPYLLVGMLSRRLYDGDRQTGIWLAASVIWLVVGVVVVSIHSAPGALAPVPKSTGSLLALPVFAAIVAFYANRSARWLLWLGTISYSLYLFQGIGLLVLIPLIYRSPLAYPPLVAAVTIGVAAVIYRCVEKPMIEAGRVAVSRRLAPARSTS